MSEKRTPGQVAYEAIGERGGVLSVLKWGEMMPIFQGFWEAAAQAVLEHAANPDLLSRNRQGRMTIHELVSGIEWAAYREHKEGSATVGELVCPICGGIRPRDSRVHTPSHCRNLYGHRAGCAMRNILDEIKKREREL